MSTNELIATILTAAGGAAVLIAGLAAWLGKVWADRIVRAEKLLADIDLDLRNRRIPVYAELWKATAILPMWPKATGVTYQQLMQFSETLRTWYFQTGGMYLSRSTHDKAYSPLQKALREVLQRHNAGLITDKDYETIRLRCSALRTALAGDLESRREGPQ